MTDPKPIPVPVPGPGPDDDPFPDEDDDAYNDYWLDMMEAAYAQYEAMMAEYDLPCDDDQPDHLPWTY